MFGASEPRNVSVGDACLSFAKALGTEVKVMRGRVGLSCCCEKTWFRGSGGARLALGYGKGVASVRSKGECFNFQC